MVPVQLTEERVERVGPLRPRPAPPPLKLIGLAALEPEPPEKPEGERAQEEAVREDPSEDRLQPLSRLISRRTKPR